jgi:hypothetical protein
MGRRWRKRNRWSGRGWSRQVKQVTIVEEEEEPTGTTRATPRGSWRIRPSVWTNSPRTRSGDPRYGGNINPNPSAVREATDGRWGAGGWASGYIY